MPEAAGNAVTPRVGVIGLGVMGAAMARNLARRGLLTAVWNRSPARAQALVQETGCIQAADPAALAALCDVLLICVSADADVRAVIYALEPGLRAGQVVIDCSTVSAETARQTAQRLYERDVDFLDAPVSGGAEGARQGTLTIMVGGSEQVLQRVLPVLQAIGQRIVHMGPAGSGQATKAVNQVLAAGINQAVCEALAFARAQGLPLDPVVDVVGSGAAGNWFINHRGKSMTRGQYAPGFKLALHHKDLAICLRMAEAAGIELPLSAETLRAYERLMALGHGEEDISALFRLRAEADKK